MAEVEQFYKDATFGVPEGGVESTISPRPGVTIVRDSAYGVPHVYGETRDDVMFGAGYVNAADRLFLMDILRHTGRAELSSFIGGSPSNREMDRAQWQFAPYTEEDLQAQVDNAEALYGRKGTAVDRGRPRLRRRHQRLHQRGPRRPEQAARRVRGARQAPRGLDDHRHRRRGLADRRHLRQGRRARARLGADHAGVRRTLRRARRPPGLVRLPLAQRPGGADDRGGALPVPDRSRVRQAGPRDPRPGHGDRRAGGGAASTSHDSTRALRIRGHRGKTGHRAGEPGPRLELGAGVRRRVDDRPSDRGARAPGRLLPAADPDGGGPARARNRRPRRHLPRRRALRAARPRPRLRLVGHHRDERQRRHLRRGPVPGRLPLPLQGRVPGDGEARAHEHVDAERGRRHRAGHRDADRLPDRSRDRLRARHDRRQGGRLRARPLHLLPRGRLGALLPSHE